jgi:nucleotide-binding universal stress UspA family protein
MDAQVTGGNVLNVNRIVVYTDLSPASADALRAAHAVARAAHASVEVLRVVGEPLQADWTSELSTAGMPAVQDAIEAEAREWLGGILGDVETDGIDLAVEAGDPVVEIVRHVSEQRPDLLVLGAPVDRRADDGTLAERIVASAECSVLVVRGPIVR